jgi:hypothetical protein
VPVIRPIIPNVRTLDIAFALFFELASIVGLAFLRKLSISLPFELKPRFWVIVASFLISASLFSANNFFIPTPLSLGLFFPLLIFWLTISIAYISLGVVVLLEVVFKRNISIFWFIPSIGF